MRKNIILYIWSIIGGDLGKIIFFYDAFTETLVLLGRSLTIIVSVLLAVAFSTLVERKALATLQRRRGPVQVGYWGLLQPFADALKLVVKETILPVRANIFVFIYATILAFTFSMNGYCVIPLFDGPIRDTNLAILYILASSSLGGLAVILAGWASNSKYSFLGSLRCAAQLIAYELTIGIIILTVAVITGSLNIGDIVDAQRDLWNIFPYSPLFGLFFLASLAETNRPPFDLPESESELVSGYNTEYSGVGFALFFIAEYGNILLLCSLQVLLFFGGWLPFFGMESFGIPGAFWFFLKLGIVFTSFMWVRASLPRYRYDQLMRLGWKVYLPTSLFWFILTVIMTML
jgi:NADH-quinone oxidoreductase subunit H